MGSMQLVEAEMDRTARTSDEGPAWNARFAALAEEHGRLLFRIAHGLLRNAHDAEDAVQEALLRVFKSGLLKDGKSGLNPDGHAGLRDGCEPEIANEKAYLARTVWRAGLDIAARRPKRTESIDGDDGDGANARREFAARGRSAEEQLAAGDERELLRILIDGLPEDLRQPLVLSAIEEMTSREVAAALGIPEGTVRTRAMRARAELRKRFETIRARTKATADSHG
jgi:RNA polymerase sigma-70 factor, ECF subfamily